MVPEPVEPPASPLSPAFLVIERLYRGGKIVKQRTAHRAQTFADAADYIARRQAFRSVQNWLEPTYEITPAVEALQASAR